MGERNKWIVFRKIYFIIARHKNKYHFERISYWNKATLPTKLLKAETLHSCMSCKDRPKYS